jgi:hypothetical protein
VWFANNTTEESAALGFRSAVKKGGGFLVGDGTLVDYEFSQQNYKGDETEWIYFVPSILMDGADAPITQHLFLGAADRFAIEDDGKTLSGERMKFGGTPTGRFFDTMIEASDKVGANIEEDLPNVDDGENLNLEGIVNRRFRFGKEVDEKANGKLGEKPRKKDGKAVKDKDGKPVLDKRTTMIIEAVLATSNGNGNGHKATSAKKAAKGPNLNEEAEAVLRDIIEGSKVPVLVKNLKLVATSALLKNANKDALRTLILDDEFRSELSWLAQDKKGVLTIDE